MGDKGNNRTNHFAETIAKVSSVAGFDNVATALRFSKCPDSFRIGSEPWEQWRNEKRMFFKTLFWEYPLAATLCYSLCAATEEASYSLDFSQMLENNKDEYFARWFTILCDDYAMVRDCGYFHDHGCDIDKLFDLLAKEIHAFLRGKEIEQKSLYHYQEQFEQEELESLRCDAEYMANLVVSGGVGHDFWNAKDIASSLGVWIDDYAPESLSQIKAIKKYNLIKRHVWDIYNKYKIEVLNGVITKIEEV